MHATDGLAPKASDGRNKTLLRFLFIAPILTIRLKSTND